MAYCCATKSDLVILGAVSIFFIASIGLLQAASHWHWRFRSPKVQHFDSPLSRVITLLRRPEHLPRWSYIAVAGAAFCYGLLVIVRTPELSNDVRELVLALIAVSLTLLAVLREKPLILIDKSAIYIAAAVFAYLDTVSTNARSATANAAGVLVLTMAVGTVLRLRLAADRRFELTPLDLIVLFVALVVPSLSGNFGLPHGGAVGIAKLVILFYAIEALVNRIELLAAVAAIHPGRALGGTARQIDALSSSYDRHLIFVACRSFLVLERRTCHRLLH